MKYSIQAIADQRISRRRLKVTRRWMYLRREIRLANEDNGRFQWCPKDPCWKRSYRQWSAVAVVRIEERQRILYRRSELVRRVPNDCAVIVDHSHDRSQHSSARSDHSRYPIGPSLCVWYSKRDSRRSGFVLFVERAVNRPSFYSAIEGTHVVKYSNTL